ncbi:MAG: preprotein translocase subunit YajC [Thermodesulfovibrionales bacterium]
MLESLAWAMGPGQQGGGAQGGPGSVISGFLPLIIIFVIFYFLLIRPQQKRAKQHRDMIGSLKKGDKVVTSGGIYGVVESVAENTVVLKIGENVKVKFGKTFISSVRSSADED